MRWQTRKVFHFEVDRSIGNTSISHFKASPIDQNSLNVKSVRLCKKIKPESNLEFGTIIQDRQIIITEPIKLANEANSSEGWRAKHARHKAQKKAVFVAMLPIKHLIKMPCTLKVTRFAPKELDRHDNLPYSAKWVMDQLCAEITGDLRPGRADNYQGFTFEYDQVKSKKYATKIEIWW
jgi:hypothetical protein